MKLIRNIFAIFGFACFLLVGFFAFKYQDNLQRFDNKAIDVYMQMASRLLETQDIAEAMVWKVKVDDDLTPDDVEDAMLSVAAERNIAITGVLRLGEDIENKTGKPYRYVKIFTFCRSRVAAIMMDYSDAYSSFMPCRIAMVEDKSGKYWLYSMDMDPMIYGGKPLPQKLKTEAIKIRDIMLEMMHRGAAGDF
jgi:uncharacterized protein (DUF302 family)